MQAGWISPWWQAACIPDRWEVCGVSVPALSVWHTFALENIGNPYLCGGPVDMNSVAALLLFAQNDRQGGRRLLLHEHYRLRQMRRMNRALRRVSLERAHVACQEYTEICLRGISRWHKGSEKPCAVPYQWHMVYRISQGDPARIEAAWNMPYAVARCLCDAAAEQNGDDSIMSTRAQEMEDNWPAYEQAAQAAAVVN